MRHHPVLDRLARDQGLPDRNPLEMLRELGCSSA
jgi:hypothetical protein